MGLCQIDWRWWGPHIHGLATFMERWKLISLQKVVLIGRFQFSACIQSGIGSAMTDGLEIFLDSPSIDLATTHNHTSTNPPRGRGRYRLWVESVIVQSPRPTQQRA